MSRAVGATEYRNRLIAGVEAAEPSTRASASVAAIGDFASRLERLDTLTQKDVHDEPTAADVDFGVIHTYLIAGEVLQVTA